MGRFVLQHPHVLPHLHGTPPWDSTRPVFLRDSAKGRGYCGRTGETYMFYMAASSTWVVASLHDWINGKSTIVSKDHQSQSIFMTVKSKAQTPKGITETWFVVDHIKRKEDNAEIHWYYRDVVRPGHSGWVPDVRTSCAAPYTPPVASQQSLVQSEAHKFKKYKLATESYEHAMQAAYQTPTGNNGADDATQSASSTQQQGLAKQPSLLAPAAIVGLALAIWCMSRRTNQQGQIAAMVPMGMGSGPSEERPAMASRGSYQDLSTRRF